MDRLERRIVLSIVIVVLAVALRLHLGNVSGASTLYLPGDVFYPTVADAQHLTETYGECVSDVSSSGNTSCVASWGRGFRFNGSGFEYSLWTDARRRGFLEVWVDGVLEESVTFNYFGERVISVMGLSPGVHEVLLRVDGVTCADPEDTDNCAEPDNPRSYYFNALTVLGPADLEPPLNPDVAIESHGVQDGFWQNGVDTPAFTWPAGTDALSGVAGYEVYFGADENGTAGFFQSGTSYTAPAPVGQGRYYLRLRTKDNAENYAPWVTLFGFQLDRTPPVIALSRSGTSGLAGWWTSALALSATITDEHSGVASSSMSVDGAAPQPVVDISLETDGVHQVTYTAADQAGNVAEWVEEVWVDQTRPIPDYLVISAQPGENGWQTHPVIVQANGQDATSGLAFHELLLDGASTGSDNLRLEQNGEFLLACRAVDTAGWEAVSDTELMRIDMSVPSQQILQAPSQGAVVQDFMDFVGLSADPQSGLQGVAYRIDDGNWVDVPLQNGGHWEFRLYTGGIQEGMRRIMVRTKDMAGNATFWHVQVEVKKEEPLPAKVFAGLFARPTITPTPLPTATPTPTPLLQEPEVEEESVPVVVEEVVVLVPVATPRPVPVQRYPVEKQQPLNAAVGLASLPAFALLSAVCMFYDPRPAQVARFVDGGRRAVPDMQGLESWMGLIGTSLMDSNDKEEEDAH